MRWMIGTILVLGLCSGLGYASYVVWYQPVTNWLGYPTHAQQNEFFEFAEKIGYRPENQLGFNQRRCSDFMPQSCSMILIFALDGSFTTVDYPNLIVTDSREVSGLAPNILAIFDSAHVPISLNGTARGLSSPFDPRYPITSWVVTDKSTGIDWEFSVYQTSDYGYPLEINGVPETRDFVVISKSFK